MSMDNLLADLAQHGVELWAEGEHLNVRAPKGVLTPPLRESLVANKATILKLLREQGRVNGASALLDVPRAGFSVSMIAPDERHLPFPLNDIQQAYWLGRSEAIELSGVGAHTYIEFESDDLDLERLNCAWQQVVKRHDMLRAIVLPDGRQLILEHVSLYEIEVTDLREADHESLTAHLEAVRNQLSHQIFSLERWPLFDIRATRLEGGRIRVHFSIDLMIADAPSLALLFIEWSRFYQDPDLLTAPLSLSFRDYVLAEMAQHETDVYRSSLKYWLDRVDTLPPAPELPMAQNPGSLTATRFTRRKGSLEPQMWAQLKAQAGEKGLSPSGVLLAAFAEVLANWSNSPHFTINIASINRIPFHPEVKDLIGVFSTLNLLEVDYRGRMTFEQRAQMLLDQLYSDLEHQRVNGICVLRELARQRGAGLKAQMPVVFTSTLLDASNANWLGEIVHSISQTPQVWLDLQVLERAGTLIFQWDAVEELFPDSLLDDMFAAFSSLLSRLASDHSSWFLPSLDLLPPSHFSPRLSANLTSAPIPDSSIHSLFLHSALAHPLLPAIISSDLSLSYSQLLSRSSQLARLLRIKLPRPNLLVAVILPKSGHQILASLAILQAGAAYLPIDPDLPHQRILDLLSLGNVSLAITSQSFLDSFSLPDSVDPILFSDPLLDFISSDPIDDLSSPDDLAYVLFTSGSTGSPKGAMISHRGVVNSITWTISYFNINHSDRFFALTSLSHDMSVFDIFGALAAGAAIVVPDDHLRLEPSSWIDLIHEHSVTIWNSVPAFFDMLLEVLQHRTIFPSSPSPLDSLRLVFLGGDWINSSIRPRLASLAPSATLISVGGPTETTLWNIFHILDPSDDLRHSIPYGRPISNTQYFILDHLGRDRPTWVTGEIFSSGVGVAAGYWMDQVRTNQSFIDLEGKAKRAYRSGDLGRYLPSGEIELMGRADNQVKIGGYRVELEEIDKVLEKHPAVKAAAVVAVLQVPSTIKSLVAFILTEQDYEVSTPDLETYLRQRLPEQMVVKRFEYVDALPLSRNGKIDRKELSRRALTNQEPQEQKQGLVGETEEEIARIWREVLGIEEIGRGENFMEKGGHSVKATQVVTRMRERMGVEIRIREMFENPTIENLARKVEEQRRRKKEEEGGGVGEIRKVERGAELELSSAQQRLWFLDQLEPGNPTYTMPGAIRFIGDFNLSAFGESLNEVVRRHEAFRTSFAAVDGKPVQVIASEMDFGLPFINLEQVPNQEREALALAKDLARRPFDMARGPLWRALLLRLSEREHLLLFAAHHIIADGWSFGIIVSELASLYEAYSEGMPSPLADPVVQYADFSHWQRQMLQSELLDSQVEYWKQNLAGTLPVLKLPTDRPQPAFSSYRGARQFLVFPESLSTALADLNQKQDVTMFMTLLAAYKTLLLRYSGQEDILVGSPIANRTLPETESMVGYFANNLVLRTDMSGNPTFSELLTRVREVAIGAYSHQDVPFERLVEVLQPERGLSRTPLFQVMFAFQNTPRPTLELSSLKIIPEEVDRDSAMFDLTLCVWEKDEGLSGWLEYDTDLFNSSTIARMVDHFRTVLESVATDPYQRILDLPILTQEQRHQVIVEWNDTDSYYQRDISIHSLFEKQVELTPDAVAATFEGREITYSELNKRANQLAHHLKGLGVGPGTFLGVYIERSLEMITALLGILKSGSAYVPVETNFPKERIHYILSSLETPCLVTQSARLSLLDGSQDQIPTIEHIICLDEIADPEPIERAASGSFLAGKRLWTRADLDRLPADDLGPQAHPDDMAYIIFTSGSTGSPKGVMVTHRPVINLIEWVNQRFNIGSEDRVLFITSLCFDLSVYDIFGLLAAGGSIRVASSGETQDPGRLLQILCEEPITFWDSAPPALQQLSPMFGPEKLPGRPDRLRLVFLSGDWIPVTLPDAVRSAFKNAEVISLGGATEATVWSNFFPVGRVNPQWVSIPYGRPIQNARYYILNSRLIPCPVGVPGDLYIGGECLCSGYGNDPVLTAQKFIPDPFSLVSGQRIYKTGDLARFFPDGNMEFLGRIDHQVKVRGFRIELGEIEAALSQHEHVRDSVVIACGEARSEKRLVAYIVATEKPGPTVSELRSFLSHKLPEYMLPSTFIMLDELPLTGNGKLDRRALPEPDKTRPDLEASFVAPRTQEEKILAGIWADVLGIKSVGVHDDFFELGGHSMLATQIVSRVRRTFQIEFPLHKLFSSPTVAQMALIVGEALIAELEELSEDEAQHLIEEDHVGISEDCNV